MNDQKLFRACLRALRAARNHPLDAGAKLLRSLCWAECFHRGKERIFNRAIEHMLRNDEHRQVERLKRRKG